MKRRDFFKATGWILAALGISESDWLRLGDRYYQAIASPLNRKLALLVGINQYPGKSSLNGCLTDVELQKELLIHRFGFHSSDILTLTNAQATRRQIEDAFTEHLTNQAQSGDIVVFHFSGYGRRLQLSQKQAKQESERLNTATLNSLVTADSGADNDLPENTLALLLRSLSTTAVTTILDTSFNFPDVLPSYLRVRSLPQLEQWQLVPAEIAFQQQLIDRQKLRGNLASVQMPPTVLRAADADKVAVEAQWTSLVAGLFTYALTQYLWEFTSPNSLQVNLGKVGGVVEQTVSKQTYFSKSVEPSSLLLMSDSTIAGADGVVRAIEDDGKTAHLWLAGLPATVLEYYGVNSRLSVAPPKTQPELAEKLTNLQLQVRSRTGLTAKAQIISNNATSSLQVGQLLQEAIRVLPRNISLNVALDPSLERIERVDATSAFAAMPRVSLITASDVPVDYVFGRVIETTTPASRYGLFFPDREPIPNTTGEAGEAAKVAVQRLIPKLRSLLAAKLWRLTNNSGSSQLAVKANLEIVSPEELTVMQQYSVRSQLVPIDADKSLPNISLQLPAIPVGSRIQYRLQNYSDFPVYFLLFGLDSTKSAIALYPLQQAPQTTTEAKPLLQDIVIPPGESIIVPQTAVDFQWLVRPPLAIAETHLIFSTASFTQTLAALQSGLQSRGEQGYIGTLANPLEVAQAIFQDLHNASAVKIEPISSTADTYNLDVNTWASFNFIYQIV